MPGAITVTVQEQEPNRDRSAFPSQILIEISISNRRNHIDIKGKEVPSKIHISLNMEIDNKLHITTTIPHNPRREKKKTSKRKYAKESRKNTTDIMKDN